MICQNCLIQKIEKRLNLIFLNIPIDIIYEPTLDENKKIECFFARDISLAYVGYIEKIRNNEKYLESRITRQCHYCTNFFVKSEKK